MISEDNIQSAIAAGILDKATADALKAHATSANTTSSDVADEEHFRLISGFNDIFVVIASLLLITSLKWIGGALYGNLLAAIAAWGLAEFFVLKRRMALPAIVLLLAFVSYLFAASKSVMMPIGIEDTQSFIIPSIVATVAAWLNWLRFKVPITIAAGTAALVTTLLASLASINTPADFFTPIATLMGLCVFAFAMYWDKQDTQRQTRKSDVAFWLHLLAAPIIIHPVFELIGVLHGNINLIQASFVLILYIAIAVISLLIDRRALMVSALGYVVYVFSTLLNNMGHVGIGFAVTAFTIGSALLLLSAFWHKCRGYLLNLVPNKLKAYLPN
ncbi:MAG: hypothetical protein P8N23_07000 [Methylophilaceae bacterium]|jgi:hypothetical protein|nr:hypothetical protein [Methylophilaceae bacterium]MDG1453365.1 hypothetical protein [Methylophilaceae bacterium]